MNKFYEKLYCPRCEIGEKIFFLDSKEPFCPYLLSFTNKKCPFYKRKNKKKEKTKK